MQTNAPIQYAVDSNIVGLLGLASHFSKSKFITIVEQNDDLYEKLLWLDALLQSEKVDFVVPYYSYQKLIKDTKITAQMSEDRKKQIQRSNFIRKYARIYMQDCPGIKIAYATKGLKDYKDEVMDLAKEYSEDPLYPDDIATSHFHKQKPFLRLTSGTITTDTLVMAEATLMGLNLITTDYHFLAIYPYDVRQNIQKMNKNLFNSNVTAVSLDDFFELVMPKDNSFSEIRTDYNHPTNPELIEFELFKKQDYIDHLNKVIAQNKEYWERRHVATSRTLWCNYIEKLVDLPSLKPENLDIDAQILNSGLIVNPETNILEPMAKPVEEQQTTQTKIVEQVQKSPKPRLLKSKNATTRIKFDFNSPNATKNINDFLNSIKKENHNLEEEHTL